MVSWRSLDPVAPEFVIGLRSGVVVVAFALPIALAWRRVRQTPFPAAGLVLTVGVVMGIRVVDTVPSRLAFGLAGLAVGGLAAGVFRASPILGIALAAPGSWVVASDGDLTDVGLIRVLVWAVAAVGAALAADLDGRWRATGAPPILLAVSAAGVYFTVPETDEAAILLGGAAAVALLGLGAVANLGSAGAFAAVGLLVWTVATGGAARPSSIVGGLGCLGLFLVEPLARLFAHGRSGFEVGPRSWRVISAVGAQVLLVAIASRWAGLQPVAETAALVVMAEFGVALAILVGSERARPTGASSVSEHGGSS